MKNYEKNIPKILYKYRTLDNGLAEKILSNGEVYFARTDELEDLNEKSSFQFTDGIWIKDKNNELTYLTPEQRKELFLNAVRSGKDEPYGILSLCDSREEIQMFELYADEFEGICIGFDWQKFNIPFAGSYPPVTNTPRRVIYQPPIEIACTHVTPDKWIEIFCSKFPQFSFEKECRMFYEKGKLASPSVRNSIKEIIFGYKVSPTRIFQLILLVKDLPEVDFYIAREVNNKIQIETLNLEKMRSCPV